VGWRRAGRLLLVGFALVAASLALLGRLVFGPEGLACAMGTALVIPAATRVRVRHGATAIVGCPDFCNDLADAARRSGRLVVTWIVPEGHATAFGLPAILSYSDVVLDDRLLEAFRPNLEEIVAAGAIVRVAHRGQPPGHVFDEPLQPFERAFKRGLDVILGLLLMAIAAPVLVLAVIAIKIDSPGAALFVRQRVGMGGRRFRLYKLRTMAAAHDDALDFAYLRSMVLCSAPAAEGIFKPSLDARVTRVGRILRRYSIDELPQLVNVLKGEMSLVGPRPSLISEVDVYDDVCMQRLRVRPGITGLSQISGRSSLRFDEIVALDMAYCDTWSPWLELKILAKTVTVLLGADGAG
jgi:lipopolysaccharide/colanic/teichoic acid biosynthesis glycosyltransferase